MYCFLSASPRQFCHRCTLSCPRWPFSLPWGYLPLRTRGRSSAGTWKTSLARLARFQLRRASKIPTFTKRASRSRSRSRKPSPLQGEEALGCFGVFEQTCETWHWLVAVLVTDLPSSPCCGMASGQFKQLSHAKLSKSFDASLRLVVCSKAEVTSVHPIDLVHRTWNRWSCCTAVDETHAYCFV